MRTAAAPPYLLPPDEAVTPEDWRMLDGAVIGERLDHWDPFTEVELTRAVTVDMDVIREACGLGADSCVALTASWRSDRTRIAEAAGPVELGTLTGRVRAPVDLTIPGARAGGRVDLLVRLVLRFAGTAATAISPIRPGAILWTDTTRLVLEGGAARFPVTAVDFAGVGRLPSGAAWALEWDPDELEAPLLGGFRLLVNAGNQRLLDAVRSGSNDRGTATVRSFVTLDVARSLVQGALRNERFVAEPEGYEDGTLGRMLLELIAACWPGIPVPALRSRSLEEPARLEAELQAHLGVMQ